MKSDCLNFVEEPKILYPQKKSVSKYVSLLSDYGFKYVFGKIANKEIIIAFLNEVIPDRVIVDIEQLRNEHLPYLKGGKKSRFDLYCKTDDGSRVIIEMQNQEEADFVDRAIYYSTFPVQDQVEEGQENYLFAPIYSISILNFNLDEMKGEPGVKSTFRLKELETGKILSNKYTFIFIELKKFNKTLAEIEQENILERFYFCLRYMEYLEERPVELQQEIFQKLFIAANIAAMSKQEFKEYQETMKTERDINSIKWTAEIRGMERGMKEGMEKGMEKGIEKGKQEQTIIFAMNLKADGFPSETIAKYTGLSVEQIEML